MTMPRAPNPRNEALKTLVGHQMSWAGDRQRFSEKYSGYVLNPLDNLFLGILSSDAERDLSHGSGNEFRGRRHKKTGVMLPPKFNALKSSSVLVYNVFNHWRNGGEKLLGEALGCSAHIATRMELEAKFQNGISLTPCNLDAALYADDGWVCAVEGKFTEPLGRKTPLKPEYLPQPPSMTPWAMERLIGCDALARDYSEYSYLDVPQLLKHTLGLHRTTKRNPNSASPVRDRYRLVYLYYDVDGDIGKEHTLEVEKFKKAVSGAVDFVGVTYQELVKRLKDLSNDDPAHSQYFAYLKNRYQLG